MGNSHSTESLRDADTPLPGFGPPRRCRNDPSKTYSGLEPSPKGFGFCAHSEEEGMERKGRDSMTWTVKGSGKSKKWVSKGGPGIEEMLYNMQQGDFYVVRKDGYFRVAREEILLNADLKKYDDDPSVLAILTSCMSSDCVIRIRGLIDKQQKKGGKLSGLSRQKKADAIMKDYRYYFEHSPERLDMNTIWLMRNKGKRKWDTVQKMYMT